jgi:hypothetical protein
MFEHLVASGGKNSLKYPSYWSKVFLNVVDPPLPTSSQILVIPPLQGAGSVCFGLFDGTRPLQQYPVTGHLLSWLLLRCSLPMIEDLIGISVELAAVAVILDLTDLNH